MLNKLVAAGDYDLAAAVLQRSKQNPVVADVWAPRCGSSVDAPVEHYRSELAMHFFG